jgi:putative hydrolase of the HAD superfamily
MSDIDGEKLSDLKAVIFDYGDVLCLPPKREQIEASAKILGISLDLFRTLWRRHRDLYDRGDFSAEVYWRTFAEDAGQSIDAAQVRELAQRDVDMWSCLNGEMVSWLQNVSAMGMKTAVLSNMHADMVQYARQNFSWLNQLTCATFSAEVRSIKPQPIIYEQCLRGLGTPPSQTLFIDDREVNIVAARALGMHAIQFKSISQLRSDLEAGGFPNLPSPAGAQTTEVDPDRSIVG